MRGGGPIFVIGAGPGGIAAAWALARAGLEQVTLVEKACWPRAKACAGGLGPRAMPWLRRKGVYGEVAEQGRAIDAMLFTNPRGQDSILKTEGLTGFVLRREVFDRILLEHAMRAGVAFLPETRVRSIANRPGGVELATSRGDLEGVAAIVATGAVASIAGVHQPERVRAQAIMARYEGVAHDPCRIELAYPRGILPFYVWLFPEPEGIVNVGLMAAAQGPSLHTLFDEVLMPHFGQRLYGATLLGRRHGAAICYAEGVRRLGAGRLLLTGEAAGLVNGFSGEGIVCALESGEIAGCTLAEAIMTGESGRSLEVRYRLRIERRFARTLRRARAALRFFRSPLFPLAADLMAWRTFREAAARLLVAA